MDPLAVIAVVGAAWALLASYVTRRRLDRCRGQMVARSDEVTDLTEQAEKDRERIDNLAISYGSINQEIGELRAFGAANRDRGETALAEVSALKEQLHQLNRKKVRRRNPRTGRFESVYEDEIDA